MSAPSTPPRPDAGSRGPESSDASLRAALERERLGNAQLRELADRQQAMLRRRSVRLVLSIDRRSRTLRARAHREVARGRRRAAQARLLLEALPARRAMEARRRDLADARAALPAAAPDPRTVSLVVLATGGRTTVPAVRDRHVDAVLVLTDASAQPPAGFGGTVVRAAHKTPTAALRDAARRADGDLLCFVRSTSEPLDDGWLARLTGAVEDDVVAAVPVLLHPERPAAEATPHDLRVRAAGVDVVADDGSTPAVRARGAGGPPRPDAAPEEVAAGTSAGLLVRRDAYLEAGGLGPLADVDVAFVDLCGRLRAGGARVVVVPSALLTDHRPVPSVGALTRPVDPAGADWTRVVDRQPTTLRQLAAHSPVTEHLLVRITVAAPSLRVAHRWGDWHLAEGLANGLRRHGHSVHLQTLAQLDDAPERPGDVHLVLRGAAPVPRRGEARRVLWVISHPESVGTAECDEADLVLVASEAFAAELRTRTSTPVEVVLQATDPRRFSRQPPDPRHAHAVAVVAMTRHVFRPVVKTAIEVGLRPAIYGADWREFVDPALIVAPFVHNHRLPVVYSSVGVLLNDHWDSMRGWGFVSNRLYDALACETPIVSDALPEVSALFGDAVATYDTADSLRAAVDEALDDPVAARQRAGRGRDLVLAAHTFDHRADELVDHLRRHDLVRLR